MSRPKIKTALVAIFALTALAVAALSWFSVSGMQVLHNSTTDIATNRLPSVSIARQIETAIFGERLAFAKHILAANAEKMDAAEAGIKAQDDLTKQVIDNYGALVTSDQERQLHAQISESFTAYRKLGDELIELSRDNDKEFAKALFDGEMSAMAAKVIGHVNELVTLNTDAATQSYTVSQATFATVFWNIAMTIGLTALILVGAVIFALRGIAKPIQTITTSMTRLAGGNTGATIPYAGRADEIGEMAGAVEVFRKAALANKALEEEALAARAAAEADRARLQQEAEASAQARLQEATSGLATGLRRLAGGDLSFELTEAFAPDFEPLRHDLNAAIAQLAETLRAVSDASGSIDSGSREISQGSNDLSKRTEQQAASLEETAAALDQITANVSNSSKRADEARSVAMEANASATRSGAVVANAVNAMQKIEQSSSQISNIIGVIDEIAFQTNLLALNAGVEAARAGEAGKGFAVVAQEVRELAQRSAQAAKEIKELIRNSSTEVQGGVKLVRETGEALKSIEGLVVTINQHMDAIATSAREQSTGLAEVNTAVNQMDQVTQQNAAMVEETNAASATLSSEASRLRGLIGQFQLGQSTSSGTRASSSGQAAALRQTAAAMSNPRRSTTPAAPPRSAAPARARSAAPAASAAQDDWQEF